MPTTGFDFGQVFDLSVGCARLDRGNALLRTRLRLVTLAGGDDLTIRRLEVEPELTVGHPFLEPW